MNIYLQNMIDSDPEPKFRNFDDYMEITSNEILYDDVFLYRAYDVIKDDAKATEKEDGSILSIVLYEIIWRIMQKGGKPVDVTGGLKELIESYGDNYVSQKLAMEIASFQVNNPDYGEDWGGVWFYPTELTAKLRKELDAKYAAENEGKGVEQ